MNVRLTGGTFTGCVTAPSSKSAAHRMLILAALSGDASTLRINGMSDDIRATMRCLFALGARFTEEDDKIYVEPLDLFAANRMVSHTNDPVGLLVGESGTTLRLLIPVVGALGISASFVMEGRLPERPISPLGEELCRHGMRLQKAGNVLTVSGRMQPGAYEIPGNVSSQFISGLLLALPLLDGPSTLTVTGTVESAGYIAMTEQAIASCGVVFHKAGRTYEIPGFSIPRSFGVRAVEGDWSSAAAILSLGALSDGPVTVCGLTSDSAQGDRAIVSILRAFGARVTEENGAVTVQRSALHGITVDASNIPDLVPVIAAVASLADGTTTIKNAGRLRLKESDRLETTRKALNAVGASVTESEDGLSVTGKPRLTGGVSPSYRDHRIAMALAVASLGAKTPVMITEAECIRKSYPAFFRDIERLGGGITYEYELR